MAEHDVDFASLRKDVSGTVVTPDLANYETARRNFIARFDTVYPQAIVYCSSKHDVSTSILFARRHNLPLSIRSGGHCFAGFSLCPGIVIDLKHINHVDLNGQYAVVGSGCRLGEMCDKLCGSGVTVPCGSCPSVGIGGTTLGGGLGILGRRFGLTCDHLVAAEVVLANGRTIVCDERNNDDLFWAIRGAGAGNFGVATSFTFRLRPVESMTNFYIIWNYQHAAAVMSAWQSWAWSAPDEMAAGLAFTMSDNLEQAPIVELYGAFLGGEPRTSVLLDDFIAKVGCAPQLDLRRHLPFRETLLFQAGLLKITDSEVFEISSTGQVQRQGIRWTRSEFFHQPIPAAGIDRLVQTFVEKRQAGQLRGLEFAPFGGQYNRIQPDATAFFHRDQMFSLKHVAIVSTDANQGHRDMAHGWITDSWSSVRPWGSGYVYPNFPDVDLLHPMQAYYGENYPRLLSIKRKYDPDNLFCFEHSLR